MRTERRIIFACFTGAGLGAVVALQLHFFWWLGILAGGATGYLTFSFRDVITAAVTAWKSLTGGRFGSRALTTGLLNVAQFLAVLAGVIFCAASVLLLSIGALMLITGTPESSENWKAAPSASALMPIPPLFWALAGATVLLLGIVLATVIVRSANRKQTCMGILGCIAATPLVLPITLILILAWAILPRGARLLWRLARQTFVLIHSEMRLLCMTDALLGALVGYVCGNALIGGFVGAAMGWVNYRFVSVRWLKLAKA